MSFGSWARWQIFPENDKIFLFENKKNENSREIFLGDRYSFQIIWKLYRGYAAKLYGSFGGKVITQNHDIVTQKKTFYTQIWLYHKTFLNIYKIITIFEISFERSKKFLIGKNYKKAYNILIGKT